MKSLKHLTNLIITLVLLLVLTGANAIRHFFLGTGNTVHYIYTNT